MINRILERLEEKRADAVDKWDGGASHRAYTKAIEIVQEVAKEYGKDTNVVKWIPCNERLPKCEWGAETKALLFQMAETNTIYCGYYGEGGTYRDKYFRTYTNATDGFDAKDVIAWQPLPAPYQKGE